MDAVVGWSQWRQSLLLTAALAVFVNNDRHRWRRRWDGYDGGLAGMVHAWVSQKLVNMTFYEFLRCPIFDLGSRSTRSETFKKSFIITLNYYISHPIDWYITPLLNFLAIQLDRAISGV